MLHWRTSKPIASGSARLSVLLGGVDDQGELTVMAKRLTQTSFQNLHPLRPGESRSEGAELSAHDIKGQCLKRGAYLAILSLAVVYHAAAARAAEPPLTAEKQAQLDAATKLNEQVENLFGQGRYAEAVKLEQQVLAIREQVLGPNHPDVATSLKYLAGLYRALGNYSQVEPLSQRALKIDEKGLGPDHPELAIDLTNLAQLFTDQGKYVEAEPVFQRALRIAEKALGPDHPKVAYVLHAQAALYVRQGKYAQAEPLMQRELKIRETALGPDHQWLAASLNNLAELYREQGKYAEAEPLYRRALKIDEKAHGTDHPEHAVYLNNLALLYHMESKYDQAEPLYQQALKIDESARGPDHPMVAIRLDNLAALYNAQGKFADAEPLYQRALEIDEKALGPAHPHFAICLNNLAALYATQGKYVQAEPLYQRALKNDLNALGPDHPDVARELFNLASIQGAEGLWPQAAKYVDQGRHIIRRHAAHELPTLSAKDQLTFLQVTDAGPFHGALSLGLIQRADSMIVAKSAAWLLNGKAVAQEALTQSALLARESSSPSAATAIKQLLESRRQLATLAMSTPQAGQEAQRRQHLEKLQTQEADLARQVSQATGGRIAAEPWAEVETIRKAIPADGILIDLARFDIFNFQATGTEKKFLSAHYAGWIVPPVGRGEVQIVDLGLAGNIDRAVDAVRDAMQRAMGDSQRQGAIHERGEGEAEKLMQIPLAELAELVWAPIAKQIAEDTKEIILSPDASLWLVPWGALPIEDGKYAIEKYNIHYVTSGRDLASHAAAESSSKQSLKLTQPVVFANPDYDVSASQVAFATRSVLRSTVPLRRAAPVEGSGVIEERRSIGAPSKADSVLPKVSRLPGTAVEAVAIKPKIARYAHQEPITYLDQYATKGIFAALKRPQILVMSTHGFFLPDQEVKHDGHESMLTQSPAQRPGPVLTVDGERIENPLLRCGLMLAGCNRSGEISSPQPPAQSLQQNAGQAARAKGEPETFDDGILTGMEIVDTDLRGTELVMLSACETGLGQVHTGEGVAGLRQAFQLAGAKSVVATLWQIPDKDSAQLVSQFFENLANGQSKAEALRNAQLRQIEAHRQRFGAAHPFFWAAFTITGD
jgi:CHAT domain-containing protein